MALAAGELLSLLWVATKLAFVLSLHPLQPERSVCPNVVGSPG